MLRQLNNIKNKARAMTYAFLRWTEKWTKTDMVYLAKGGFWLIFGQIAASISSFILSILFANLLPKETYGTYKYIISIAGVLSITTLTGMNTAVVRAVSRGHDQTVIKALKAKIKWGTLGGLTSLFIAYYYFYIGNTELSVGFLIVALFIPFMNSFGIYDALLIGRGLFKKIGIFFITSQLIAFLVMLITIMMHGSIYLIILSYFASWTTARLLFLSISLKKYIKNEQADDSSISYGKHLTFVNLITTISEYIDKILIFNQISAANLAMYSVAVAPVEQLKVLSKNIKNLIIPKFSKKEEIKINSSLTPKIFKFLLALLVISILYILCAPLIFKIIFPRYTDSLFYSQLFSLSIIASASIIPISILESQKKQKELYLINITTSIIQIFLILFMLYFYGIIGIIIAKIITRFFELLISLTILNRKYYVFKKPI